MSFSPAVSPTAAPALPAVLPEPAAERRWQAPNLLGPVVNSFERRITAALLLILVSMISLQIVSQQRAVELRGASASYRESVGQADRVRQLGDAVTQFRLVGGALLQPRGKADAITKRDQLTDSAIAIANGVNDIRADSDPFYRDASSQPAFAELDSAVATLLAAPPGKPLGAQQRTGMERFHVRLGQAVKQIETAVNARRDRNFASLDRAVDSWNVMVGVAGLCTILLAAGICFDLLRNVLPALRRMHDALRRLAAGDLEVAIERSPLRELNELSGALETFRVNARAVKGLAYTDPATALPNRRAFVDKLAKKLEWTAADRFVVMLADVDRFKYVNDDYGHPAGDRLISLIGDRMTEILGPGAFVARLGGDEFAVCRALGATETAARLAGDLVAAMRTPFELGCCQIAITLSLGYVSAERDAAGIWDPATETELLLRADLALYASKHSGRNCATGFGAELLVEHEIERALERDLGEAFERNELRMVYQPIHAVNGSPDEVEALVRWNHPRHGEVPPSRFIPAAERSGLMVPLGRWIYERALSDLRQWPDLELSINLSPLQLQQDGFVGNFLDCCARNGINPRRLYLEVTETVSIERNQRAVITLELLRQAGCKIALDDFGTGYSSLCLLRTFQFDRLKLDRELIGNLETDPTSRAVFDAAVTMALRIGAEVVAEGVSELSLVEPVQAAGCTHLQGYHYSRPVEADEVTPYYERDKAKRAAA
jgi:diguanylate cyclase (GGDEF)-like protein